MRNLGFVTAIVLLALVAGSASAEEVIYFTNGTVMPIRSHKVEGDQIKVDLGANGFMAFPKAVVEKIEDAPDLILEPSTGANRMFPSNPSARVYGASPRQSAGTWALPSEANPVEIDSTIQQVGGVYSKAPLANHPNQAARELRVNNIPEMRGVRPLPPDQQGPGKAQKIPTSAAPKKMLTQFKRKD